MDKQQTFRYRETEQLLQDITERQKELTEMSTRIQYPHSKKSVSTFFDWRQTLNANVDMWKLNKAV